MSRASAPPCSLTPIEGRKLAGRVLLRHRRGGFFTSYLERPDLRANFGSPRDPDERRPVTSDRRTVEPGRGLPALDRRTVIHIHPHMYD